MSSRGDTDKLKQLMSNHTQEDLAKMVLKLEQAITTLTSDNKTVHDEMLKLKKSYVKSPLHIEIDEAKCKELDLLDEIRKLEATSKYLKTELSYSEEELASKDDDLRSCRSKLKTCVAANSAKSLDCEQLYELQPQLRRVKEELAETKSAKKKQYSVAMFLAGQVAKTSTRQLAGDAVESAAEAVYATAESLVERCGPTSPTVSTGERDLWRAMLTQQALEDQASENFDA